MLPHVKIKLTRCPSCHATKAQRSPTTYVYCDFCGVLADFDFQLAISDTRSKLPGPQYEELRARLALKAQLETLTQRKVLLDAKVDPTILGGVVASVGSRTYDGSLKSQLREMGRQLLES